MNKRILNSLKNIYLSNRLNSYMIEWLFNRSELTRNTQHQHRHSDSDSDDLQPKEDLFAKMFKKYNHRQHKQSAAADFADFTRLINEHLKIDRRLNSDGESVYDIDASRLDERTLRDLFADFHKYMSFDLLNQVNATLIEPLMHKLSRCEQSKC